MRCHGGLAQHHGHRGGHIADDAESPPCEFPPQFMLRYEHESMLALAIEFVVARIPDCSLHWMWSFVCFRHDQWLELEYGTRTHFMGTNQFIPTYLVPLP